MTSQFYSLLKDKNWDLIQREYPAERVAAMFSFEEGIKAARDLFQACLIQNLDYAIQILETIRRRYPEKWGSSWKYDGYLGVLYDISATPEESYEAFYRAYKIATSSPPKLLIMLAHCASWPGVPPVSDSQAMEYVQKAIQDYLYIDGMQVTAGISRRNKNNQAALFWVFLSEPVGRQFRFIHAPCVGPMPCQEPKPQPPSILKQLGALLHSSLQTVENCIKASNWDQLISQYTPKAMATQLSFPEILRLTYTLTYRGRSQRKLYAYALELLEEARKLHPIEWDKDWRNDAFLSNVYLINLKTRERFEALQRAMKKAVTPPPELKIAFASCCCCEKGDPPVSYDRALQLTQEAFDECPCYEGAWLMQAIFHFIQRDKVKSDSWWGRCRELLEKNQFCPPLEPKCLTS